MNKFPVTQWSWTTEDFDQMGWHDNYIHAIQFKKETQQLLVDLDYILQFIDPKEGGEYYQCYISPATLVFNDVYDVVFDVNIDSELQISKIYKESKDGSHIFTIDCEQGSITLHSSGFNQYLRKDPVLVEGQRLTLNERGGVSFKEGVDHVINSGKLI